jgi:hypothetical protein
VIFYYLFSSTLFISYFLFICVLSILPFRVNFYFTNPDYRFFRMTSPRITLDKRGFTVIRIYTCIDFRLERNCSGRNSVAYSLEHVNPNFRFQIWANSLNSRVTISFKRVAPKHDLANCLFGWQVVKNKTWHT